MIGLQPVASKFFVFCGFMVLCQHAAVSLAQAVSAVCRDVDTAGERLWAAVACLLPCLPTRQPLYDPHPLLFLLSPPLPSGGAAHVPGGDAPLWRLLPGARAAAALERGARLHQVPAGGGRERLWLWPCAAPPGACTCAWLPSPLLTQLPHALLFSLALAATSAIPTSASL